VRDNKKIIINRRYIRDTERRNELVLLTNKKLLKELINNHIMQKIINPNLNLLKPRSHNILVKNKIFQAIRKFLKYL
tara:strand:+ start:2191 stop:2421 length:231 start_codon:yes stop_codon:yes gene_type:complete